MDLLLNAIEITHGSAYLNNTNGKKPSHKSLKSETVMTPPTALNSPHKSLNISPHILNILQHPELGRCRLNRLHREINTKIPNSKKHMPTLSSQKWHSKSNFTMRKIMFHNLMCFLQPRHEKNSLPIKALMLETYLYNTASSNSKYKNIQTLSFRVIVYAKLLKESFQAQKIY